MFKKIVAPVVVAGLLIGGAATATATAASAATPSATAAAGTTAGHPGLKAWLKSHRHQIRRAALAASAKAIGISPQALRAEFKSGKSVAQVAGEHGVSTDTLVADLVNAADARIDVAVTNHKLTSDQAAQIKAALPPRITKAVNHVF